MVEQQNDANPYSSPKATTENQPQPKGRPGFGYVVLLVANCVTLLWGLCLWGLIGDSYAGIAAVFFGIPFVFGQGLLVLLPTLIYCGNNQFRLSKAPLRALFTLAIVATILPAIAAVLLLVLPRPLGPS